MVDMSEHTVNVGLFHKIKADNSDDPFVLHIADLHGPFPQEEMRWNSNLHDYRIVSVDKCLACNTAWPCSTFGVVIERADTRAH